LRLGLVGRAAASYDRRFIDAMASAYLEQTAWTRLRLSAVRDLVDPRPGERILDLGSAGGAMAHFLSTFGCHVVGVDAEPLAIDTASKLFPDLPFRAADVAELPFDDASFDKAVAADLVEHLEDEPFERMLSECVRVLRPGGTLTVYTPNPRHPIERLKKRDLLLARNETHVGLRDADELAVAFRKAAFEVDRNEWRASFFPGLRTLERAAGRRLPALRYRLALRGRKPA
jgi:SAM-dependent methyltransferase